ncbi:MAG TPA: PrgI family protein [bacterium]|nr:PrgI family protein [bacterium]
MQQFTVPQFIDTEDKILGPITTRQFVILLVMTGVLFVEYKLFDFSLFVAIGVITLGFFIVFAFGKVNGRPFHLFLLNLVQSLFLPSLRLWNKNFGKDIVEDQFNEKNIIKSQPPAVKNRFSSSRLAELSLIVDTTGAYGGELPEADIAPGLVDSTLDDLTKNL